MIGAKMNASMTFDAALRRTSPEAVQELFRLSRPKLEPDATLETVSFGVQCVTNTHDQHCDIRTITVEPAATGPENVVSILCTTLLPEEVKHVYDAHNVAYGC
jgi:hypothetical protein